MPSRALWRHGRRVPAPTPRHRRRRSVRRAAWRSRPTRPHVRARAARGATTRHRCRRRRGDRRSPVARGAHPGLLSHLPDVTAAFERNTGKGVLPPRGRTHHASSRTVVVRRGMVSSCAVRAAVQHRARSRTKARGGGGGPKAARRRCGSLHVVHWPDQVPRSKRRLVPVLGDLFRVAGDDRARSVHRYHRAPKSSSAVARDRRRHGATRRSSRRRGSPPTPTRSTGRARRRDHEPALCLA